MIRDVDYEEYMDDWRDRVPTLTENVQSDPVVRHEYLDPETGRVKCVKVKQ
jgi:hypothetical protein